MHVDTLEQIDPAVLHIQAQLQKIDRLRLPTASRRDVENILVRQVSEDIDRILPWQAGHGQRTAAFSIRIGQAMQVDAEALHHLKLASLLHDIGLLMLPAHLRNGSGPLEPESYVTIQNHPRLGATLLEPFSFLRETALLIAHHHERWDGSGYPYGLRGASIPLGARILAIADAYEAMQVPAVSDQTARDRIALRILRVASGTQFDPLVVDVLVDAMAETEAVRVARNAYA
ncbi:MAG TPA: HD domain-containing phosphohydrolase [Nitrospira sp.]|nr:HD domain-containing phosphohydrolase [Nitrospira sp.]